MLHCFNAMYYPLPPKTIFKTKTSYVIMKGVPEGCTPIHLYFLLVKETYVISLLVCFSRKVLT